MFAQMRAYWRSKQSNIHGLVAFLSGSSGLVTLEALGVHSATAKAICAAAMLIGAWLQTPSSSPAPEEPPPAPAIRLKDAA